MGCVGLLGAGWFAASAFRSPAQVAADSAAPPPSTITADVTRGTLDQQITVSGSVVRDDSEKVALVGQAPLVITAAPVKKGKRVSAGSVVAELNGSPTFVIPGRFPFYRDLKEGDEGPDVAMLQRGLKAAGFMIEADGKLGAHTRDVVDALFRRNGHVSPAQREARARERENAAAAEASPESEDPDAQDDASETTDTAPVPGAQEPVVVAPLGTFVTAKTLPAVAQSVPHVGAAPDDGAALMLVSGELKITADVSTGTALALREGTEGTVDTDDGQVDVAVSAIGAPTADGTVSITLTPSSDLPSSMAGTDVVVAVTIDPGVDEALVVPTVAVIVRGDDHFVRKQEADGSFTEIPVTELATSLGRSAIAPTRTDALAAGDRVKVQ